ncbi:hypothetical protein DFH08DRAFT_948425 [Mycena albidolilacea]|uniref:DUF6534 domain-containing protein n=1 Tax=Mycena albidolilacea TaxID=1033008 RepID=A0AAD7F4F4_9AGAR|nr:hypothetical protein DFH08DRAFT_948425 [Mycena albidolilacea]
MSAAASVIKLSPPSAAFVNARTNSLGPWVLGAFLDCILMGVIFCQARTYFRTRTRVQSTLHQFYKWLVIVVLALSMLKTAQCMGVVWVQNVLDYANPDVARLLVAKAWWQVSMPLMTGIIGTIVQSFFCLRFYMLSRNWMLCVPIICAMCLGLAGVCLSLANILAGNAQAKVMWLLVHLVGVFTADFLITAGTVYMLRKRVDSGLERTTQLINRLLRLVFESAVPPTLIAMTDLIMTQTLGPKLLWHLFMNIALGKVYVVSLLYTLNSINEYRAREQTSQEVYSFGNGRSSRRTNMELTSRNPALKTNQIFVQTQVATHVSPGSPQDKTEYISGDFHNHEDDSSSDRARYGQ